MELAKLIQEAGFPDGVVNILPGYGETAGAALAAHPGIDKIAFTGSTDVGKIIAREAAQNLTKVSLELGGKAPNIIFADADIEQAVNGAMMGIFFNQGQVCCAGSRLFVAEEIKDEFLDRLKEKSQKIVVGDPMNSNTHMGPQVSEEQLVSYQGLCGHRARRGRDRLYQAASRPSSKAISRTATFSSRRSSAKSKTRCVSRRRKSSGRSRPPSPFKDEDDLIKQANKTIYGLSAGIWTRDITRAHRFAKAIHAGVIWINTFNMFNAASPFGGFKQSGYGREMGKHALDLYTQIKSVWVDLSGKPIGWFN